MSRYTTPIRCNTIDEKWNTATIYNHVNVKYLGIDIQGRDLVADRRNKESRMYQLNGEKSKKIANVGHVYFRPGGRFGVYKDDVKFKSISSVSRNLERV